MARRRRSNSLLAQASANDLYETTNVINNPIFSGGLGEASNPLYEPRGTATVGQAGWGGAFGDSHSSLA